MAKALLDSTTYIDLEKSLKHRREIWAANTIRNVLAYTQEHGNPSLSIVTVVEILKGLHRDTNLQKAQSFRTTAPFDYRFIDVTTEIGYLASEIIGRLEGAGRTIGFPDSLIAATAIEHSLTLVTSNIRHFGRVADLGYPIQLDNWRNS